MDREESIEKLVHQVALKKALLRFWQEKYDEMIRWISVLEDTKDFKSTFRKKLINTIGKDTSVYAENIEKLEQDLKVYEQALFLMGVKCQQ